MVPCWFDGCPFKRTEGDIDKVEQLEWRFDAELGLSFIVRINGEMFLGEVAALITRFGS